MKRMIRNLTILLLSGGSLLTASAALSATTGDWSYCAAENGNCIFTGTQTVRYGAGTTFVTQTLAWGASCNNAAFGDPVPGVAKHCEVSNSWNSCASENGTCSFSDTETVRYGAGTTYNANVVTGGEGCNNSVFGDPDPGIAKHCDAAPTTWTQCSAENGQCSFSGTQIVLYGANGSYTTKSLTDGAACNNGTFGDPSPGNAKHCYVPGLPVQSSGSQPTPTPTPSGLLFSPYKDVTINLNWNTNVITTNVTGTTQSAVSAMPGNDSTLTWAFATGSCGSENWGGLLGASIAAANVNAWVQAGKKYIISTGGAAGSFTCTSDANFATFINTYNSANLVGIDFDIEAGQSQADINNLVQRVIVAQQNHPNLRFSFTVATLGGNVSPSLGTFGVEVMNAIQTYGLKNYYINLMAMDYGSPGGGNCITDSSGQCQMGSSANQAVIDLHNQYGVPYSQIEVTPMIGGNDSAGETFTLADVATVSNFAKQNGLAGVHIWSLDRDNDCAPGSASPTCNSYGQAGRLGFTKAFLSDLGF
ncbi:glycosyl hydrolase family 18 protein [Andreprevotia chitinilytica]|uniref:glycosyl hydrolase family 18 protein n=1 Tax=Andreprevotia chitinilytica TaxID=396808 RepID=UPI001B804096|nr:glycosyl hydrolase family 18 protein [Andreprevotia chitinilytica]